MPSQRHESLVELFRNRPSLAAELLRDAFHLQIPGDAAARVESADFTDIQPTEYRADLVVLLSDDAPVLGIVIDVQFARDERKPFVWPVYATTLRARFECPVRLLVVAMTEAVARWAAAPINLDGSNVYTPLVLERTRVPAILDEVKPWPTRSSRCCRPSRMAKTPIPKKACESLLMHRRRAGGCRQTAVSSTSIWFRARLARPRVRS